MASRKRFKPVTRQPQGPSKLNPQLFKGGGYFLWHPPSGVLFDQNRNAGSPGLVSNLVLATGPLGLMARGGSNNGELWLGSNYLASTNYTVLALVIDDSGRGTTRNPFDADLNGGVARFFQFRLESSNVVGFIPFDSGGSPTVISGTTATSATAPSVLAGRVSGTEVSAWLNGKKDATGVIGTPRTIAASGVKLSIGIFAAQSTAGFAGQIYCCIYLPYAVPDGQLAAMRTAEDFYSAVFLPPQIPRLLGPTAGASTFKPQFANQNGSFIGVGVS